RRRVRAHDPRPPAGKALPGGRVRGTYANRVRARPPPPIPPPPQKEAQPPPRHPPKLHRVRDTLTQKWAGHRGERVDSLTVGEPWKPLPQAIVDSGDAALKPADSDRVADLVQDVVVDEAEDLARQVLRQLRDKNQGQPAFATSLGNAGHLLEQVRHGRD